MNRIPASPLILRSIEVAESKLGSAELARRLTVPQETLRAWRDGLATMPEYKFLRLVDILTELDPTWEEWDTANKKDGA